MDVHRRLTQARDGRKVSLIGDPHVPLIITEGIPKGDAAVSIELCCIALLGVWNWRGSNQVGGRTALADWDSIALNERTVYVAFDYDVMEKRGVYDALVRLKSFLESKKATVKIIYLPVGQHGEKTGLDDYIAREQAAGRSKDEIRGALLGLATDELRKPATQKADRPEIMISAGRHPEMVDQAEAALVPHAARLKIFQRANEIVRIVVLDRESGNGALQRRRGAVQLAAMSPLMLRDIFEQLILWSRPGQNGPEPADCPSRLPATYLERLGNWKLPMLQGVIEAPIMRPDGSILSASGYDESSRLFLYADSDWAAVPESPTRAHAEAALRELSAPFAEFPFVEDAARSALLAAIITAIQRRLLESAPLFGFDAPSQRSGKSLLAESVGIIATGRKPPSTGVARTDDELRKAITSALREGQLIVNLDNITRPLDSPDLARAITQSEYSDRVLGANKMLRLRTNLLWTATGNNLTFKGDMASRALLCRIDAKVEHPEKRDFEISDLAAHLSAHRKQLAIAALTILRAYHVAGRPRQNLPRWGGFDQWSREIREPLVWLGVADPCRTRERIIVNNPERDSALSILSTWHDLSQDRAVTVAEVIRDGANLKELLLTVAADRTEPAKINPRRLGVWLRSIEDRIFGDFQLSRHGSTQGVARWRVGLVGLVGSRSAGPNGATHTQHNPDSHAAADDGGIEV